MADMTMCTSKNCPMREKCYRIMAKASKFQSWSNFEYTCNKIAVFEDFIRKNEKYVK